MARSYKMRKRMFDDAEAKAYATRKQREARINREIEIERLQNDLEIAIDAAISDNDLAMIGSTARLVERYGAAVTW